MKKWEGTMNFKKSISKKSLLRRISGIALTLVMVINLMYGYSAAKAQVTEEARKASQVAAQKAEANKAPYRNVMYYGDWSIYWLFVKHGGNPSL